MAVALGALVIVRMIVLMGMSVVMGMVMRMSMPMAVPVGSALAPHRGPAITPALLQGFTFDAGFSGPAAAYIAHG
jgi:hypothetical protein